MGKNAEFIIGFVNTYCHPSLGSLAHNSFEHGIFLCCEATESIDKNLCTVKISVLVQHGAKNIECTVVVEVILFNQCSVGSVDKQNFAELVFEK